MAALTTIATVISAVAGLAGAAAPFFAKKPSRPQPKPAPQLAPSRPNDKSAAELAGLRPGGMGSQPNFLQSAGFSSLTPLQQRSQIATQGVQGASQYRSQEAKDYYQNVAQRSLVSEGGQLADAGSILPIERQFVSQVFGQQPYTGSTESFLSAVLRG